LISERMEGMATIASQQADETAAQVRSGGFRLPPWAASYLQATPLIVILGFFLLLPIADDRSRQLLGL
jgi:putative spermidine/putrescine transport system permease protein